MSHRERVPAMNAWTWTYKRVVAIAVSAYELLATTTGRVPAITDILRRHPLLGAAAVGWLAHHVLGGK